MIYHDPLLHYHPAETYSIDMPNDYDLQVYVLISKKPLTSSSMVSTGSIGIIFSIL